MTPCQYQSIRKTFQQIDDLAQKANATILFGKTGFTVKWKGRWRGPFSSTQEMLGFLKGINDN